MKELLAKDCIFTTNEGDKWLSLCLSLKYPLLDSIYQPRRPVQLRFILLTRVRQKSSFQIAVNLKNHDVNYFKRSTSLYLSIICCESSQKYFSLSKIYN